MILTGIGDEAGDTLDAQIQANRELGWQHLEARNVLVPGHPKANLHDLNDAAFDQVLQELESSGMRIYCLGSTIMNWAKTIHDPFEVTQAEVKRAIPRMLRLNIPWVRIMSFKPGDEEHRIPAVVFHRVREVTRRFLDAGIQPVHENCMNYGGMSSEHALELLDKVPGLKWLFDTANPVFNPDRSKSRPWPRQDAWEFWTDVRDHVAHIHVKDATWNQAKNDADYNWPGEGQGQVRRILADALARGYDAGISIEPHLAVVFHDATVKSSAEAMHSSYVEYGRSLVRLIEELRSKTGPLINP